MKYYLHIIASFAAIALFVPSYGQSLKLEQNIEYGVNDFDKSLSVLKLDIYSSSEYKVSKLHVQDLSGKKLWGEYSFINSKMIVNNQAGDANTLVLQMSQPCTIASEGVSFCLPVPVGTLCGGFTVKLFDDCGNLKSVSTYTSPLNISAGKEICVRLMAEEICNESVDLKRRGFYKSLFVDGGYTLNHICKKEQIPAISLLSIADDYEYYSGKDTLIQYRIMVCGKRNGNEGWNDSNGVLLYPNSEPRFRAIYVNGGNSIKHGRSLTFQGRKQINTFFNHGGSYIGTCAGSILPTTYVKSSKGVKNYYDDEKGYTFGLFPGAVERGGLPQNDVNKKRPHVFTHLKEEVPYLSTLPFFKDELQDGLAKYVRHHGGNILPCLKMNDISGVERLMTFQAIDAEDSTSLVGTEYDRFYLPLKKGDYVMYRDYSKCDVKDVPKEFILRKKFNNRIGKTVVWAYKKDERSGKLVACGSHPEDVPGHSNLFAGMIAYAIDGVGMPKVENVRLGQKIKCKALDQGIGDRQYHHYRLRLDSNNTNLCLKLISEKTVDGCKGLVLCLRRIDGERHDRENLAWVSDSEYVSFVDNNKQTLSIFGLPKGEYAISVFCPYYVKSEIKSYNKIDYFDYTANLSTQTGIRYTLQISGK